MSIALHHTSIGGVYTRFDIKNMVTGDVRSAIQSPNRITPKALAMFGNPDAKWHTFNRCLIARAGFDANSLEWGEVIPTNSNPSDPLCDFLVASEENSTPHSQIEKVDDGERMYLKATKSWTFRQGIEGVFDTVMSGLMESTTELAMDGDPLLPVIDLVGPCKLTGLSEYQNWKLHVQSTTAIDSLELTPVDVLTVTHTMIVDLPKYQNQSTWSDIDLGDGVLREFTVRPYAPAYDVLDTAGEPITRMYYVNSAGMTGGAIPGLLQSVTDGSFGTPGSRVITRDGDYDINEQMVDIDNELLPNIVHSFVFNPADGQGEIGYFLLSGGFSWYEVEVVPKINKRNIDKLQLNFQIGWG